MKFIKRFLPTIILAMLLITTVACLTACKTEMSYMFNIDTGDRITVTLNTKELKMSQENGVFHISDKKNKEEGEYICNGSFLVADEKYWKQTVDDVYEYANEDSVEVLQPSAYPQFNSSSILKYEYEDSHEMVIRIADCDTGIQLYADTEEGLNKAVENLTFVLE